MKLRFLPLTFKALLTLRNIEAFAAYPNRMQKMIVAVGQYERWVRMTSFRVTVSYHVIGRAPVLLEFFTYVCTFYVSRFEAKRIVVRQGHPGSSYYFMLSGAGELLLYITESLNCKKFEINLSWELTVHTRKQYKDVVTSFAPIYMYQGL